MTTYYSDYTTVDLDYYASDNADISFPSFYYASLNADISSSFSLPGGVLSWSKISPASSSVNACKLHQTAEATIPGGSLISQINPDLGFAFQNISGQNIFTQDFKSPSIYLRDNKDPRILSVTDEILSFIFGENKFSEKKYDLEIQNVPIKIVAGKKDNGKIGVYCCYNNNNIYAFEIEDEIEFSSSSSSSRSS